MKGLLRKEEILVAYKYEKKYTQRDLEKVKIRIEKR